MAAARGVVGTVLQLLEEGATHVGVATDHVIESFRNDLYAGYKDGSGVEPELLVAVPPGRGRASPRLGMTVCAMVEYEADDALGAAAAVAAADDRVDQVLICTPDKDLGQCVRRQGRPARPAQADHVDRGRRRAREVRRRPRVDPRLPRPGGRHRRRLPRPARLGGQVGRRRSSARYGHLEDIPPAPDDWDVPGVRGGRCWPPPCSEHRAEALLFRRIATLDIDGPGWAWSTTGAGRAPRDDFEALTTELYADRLVPRVARLLQGR